ncbi:MAG: bifunctional demethylmenaquinone methyltransferase/2-methoxy-6-polyprenyl-1,4-benzoquinol methylase UbiE [Cytophagales bacterium]|nr:MAG: bifunctional demethylmenaquinone methyltransferase/2-methoxy-6-polyprenyl-1,4-benzoquinol methylase UbiE [Cytophagales bacterium]
MFDNISGRYDFLNHFLSLGIDKLWRKKAISILKKENPKLILDVATGTADFAFEALRANPEKVIGIDISEGMLAQGRKKISKASLIHKIELQTGDSENILFPDNYFDAVIVAFGVRNFENLNKGIENMKRVLKPGGTLMILEFSKPESFPFNVLYNFYFKKILPLFGRLVSKDHRAYSYLPESVQAFPYGKAFVVILKSLGFKSVECLNLTMGISALYICKK